MTTNCDVEYLSKELDATKHNITRFLQKHFKENINYTTTTVASDIIREKSHGGQNRLQYTLSKECMELIKNSNNLAIVNYGVFSHFTMKGLFQLPMLICA